MSQRGAAVLLALALLAPFAYASQASSSGQEAKTEKKDAKKKKPKEDVEAIGNRDVGKGVNFYSIEKEIALGKQFADEVERQAKVVRDPIVAEYVNRVGQNLARHSDSKFPFTFKVIESPEINAFALPGGFCFVNTGLILEAETEAEMAGVLAHEIAHVAARHGTRQATRGTLANLATLPLIIATGGWTGYAISQAAGLAIPVAFLQFSRAFEREADFLGIQYLYAAGYDPTAFVDLFEKLASLQKSKPSALAGVFSSHPMTDDRIEEAQSAMQRILPAKPEYVVSTSEFLKVKQRLAMLLDPKRSLAKAEDRPRLRQTGGGVIRPGDKQAQAEEKEDERPVLKRGGQQSGEKGQKEEEEEGPPVLKRQP
jgi:predicted Zn-dependent protease